MNISDIRIGDRVRQDMGDLRGLADSIAKNTLLHPVVVMRDGLLVAGHRRLEAVKLLGWTDVPVTVVDVADLLSAERDENQERKDFTPTEAVAIKRLIQAQHALLVEEVRIANIARARAMARGAESADSTPSAEVGKTRDLVARAVGMGHEKLARAEAIVSAAEADPERFGDLPAKMDETGNVSGTYREMERRKADQPTAHPAESKPKPRHAIHGRAHHQRVDDEMQRAVVALEGICIALKDLDVKKLDPARVPGWSMSLSDSSRFLSKLLRRIDGR